MKFGLIVWNIPKYFLNEVFTPYGRLGCAHIYRCSGNSGAVQLALPAQRASLAYGFGGSERAI